MESVRGTTYVNLPIDVWHLITNDLDVQSLITLEKVCRFFKTQVVEEAWKRKMLASGEPIGDGNYKKNYLDNRIRPFTFLELFCPTMPCPPVSTFRFYPQYVLSIAETAQIFDPCSLNIWLFPTLRDEDKITSAACCPNLKSVVLGSSDGRVRVHNLVSDASVNLDAQHVAEVVSVNFYKDSVISVDKTGTAILQHVLHNQILGSFSGVGYHLCFPPVIMGCYFIAPIDKQAYAIWDLNTQQRIVDHRFSSDIVHVASYPRGWIAFGLQNGTIEITNTNTLSKPPISISNHKTPVRTIKFNSDQTLLSLAQDDSCISEQNLQTGKKRKLPISSTRGLSSFTIHHDVLYVAERNGRIHILNSLTGKKIQSLMVPGCNWIYCLEMINDQLVVIYDPKSYAQKMATLFYEAYYTPSQNGAIEVFNGPPGTPCPEIDASPPPVTPYSNHDSPSHWNVNFPI